jgi:xylulokinase
MGVVLSAGGAFAWYRDQCARELPEQKRDDMLVDEARGIAPGAEGVTFLPYLQGERTPHRDASLRAAFTGLSLAHSRAHMTRAVLEGVCFALRDSVTILERPGLDAELPAADWRRREERVHSPVAGRHLRGGDHRESRRGRGVRQRRLLAGVGAGAFPDLQSAAQRTPGASDPQTFPNSATHRAYEPIYQRFQAGSAHLSQ